MIDQETIKRVIKRNEDYCKNHITSIQTEKIKLSDIEVENLWLSYIAEQALTFDEYKTLLFKTEENPELGRIMRKVFLHRSEFTGGGLVRGIPHEVIDGTPIQDDLIPARLEQRCFVIRAKTVTQIGADVLQELMEQAERDTDNKLMTMVTSR